MSDSGPSSGCWTMWVREQTVLGFANAPELIFRSKNKGPSTEDGPLLFEDYLDRTTHCASIRACGNSRDIQLANRLYFLDIRQTENYRPQGRVGLLKHHEEIFLSYSAIGRMNQLPPAPNGFLDFGWALVAFDHGVYQFIDLALDCLVGDRNLLWHCPPPGAVCQSNTLAKRIPK